MKIVSPMNSTAPAEITPLLLAWRAGDQAAFERLYPLVEVELRRLARRCLRKERANHTLQTTALVNEAYLRLIDASQVQWSDRVHFYSVAARLMRRVLVDHARRRGYQRRGGGLTRVTFGEALTKTYEPDFDILALDVALDKLAALKPRAAQVVELHFFGGLSVEETAEVLSVSARTVKLDWSTAKLWLLRELSGEGAHDE